MLSVVKKVFSQVAVDAPTGPYFGTVINAKEEGGSPLGIYIEQEDESFLFSFYCFPFFIPDEEIEKIIKEGATSFVTNNNNCFSRFAGTTNLFELGDEDGPLEDIPPDTFYDIEPCSEEWQEVHDKVVKIIVESLFN